jgi:hypothetical protein
LTMLQVLLDWEKISKTILKKVFILIVSSFLPYLGYCVQKFEKQPSMR